MEIHKKLSENFYKRVLDSMPIPCVELIIFYNRKILLVYRKFKPAENKWWIPGGRIYKNERLEDAAKRKAFEELGLTVKIIRKVGVYNTFFNDGPFGIKNGVHTINHTINAVFVVAPKEKKFRIKLDQTSFDFKWIGSLEKNLAPYIKKLISDTRVFD